MKYSELLTLYRSSCSTKHKVSLSGRRLASRKRLKIFLWAVGAFLTSLADSGDAVAVPEEAVAVPADREEDLLGVAGVRPLLEARGGDDLCGEPVSPGGETRKVWSTLPLFVLLLAVVLRVLGLLVVKSFSRLSYMCVGNVFLDGEAGGVFTLFIFVGLCVDRIFSGECFALVAEEDLEPLFGQSVDSCLLFILIGLCDIRFREGLSLTLTAFLPDGLLLPLSRGRRAELNAFLSILSLLLL